MNDLIGIVWNPTKIEEEELHAAIDAASEPGASQPEFRLFETSAEDPGRGATEAAIEAGCTVVVAAGGDGTVREVAEVLGEHDGAPDLGILPLGTGNLLARNLGIPLGDHSAALTRVVTGEGSPLDLGIVELRRPDGGTERHGFAVMVGFGIDAQMIAETDDDLKDRAGWLAYVESLGRAVSGAGVREFTAALDSGDAEPHRGHTLLVANCGTIQGGITLLPDADPSDGRLDLLLLSADGVGAWLDTMRNLVWDNGLKRLLTGADSAESSETAAHRQAGRIAVDLDAPVVFEIDGEEVGEISGFETTILPSALRVR
ncbi:diacylglycerol/lipid kinase family protein [Leucobacter iarius]|uniref:Diacylglycerol kinase family protein n=1 Tax=Leucobacter iarius TaxID=333963 RepID=A0ABN2LPX7_9MICO